MLGYLEEVVRGLELEGTLVGLLVEAYVSGYQPANDAIEPIEQAIAHKAFVRRYGAGGLQAEGSVQEVANYFTISEVLISALIGLYGEESGQVRKAGEAYSGG